MYHEIAKVITEAGVTDVQCHRERIEVSSCSGSPDPGWQYIDKQGHNHWMSGKKENQYPTLIRIIDHEAGEDDEYGSSGHYECAICGETIHPGWLPPTGMREFVGGPLHGTMSFSDGKTIHLTGDDLERLNTLIWVRYDYGYTKLRAFIEELKTRTY